MINEEMTQKDINVAVRIGSITITEIRKAIDKILAKLEEIKKKPPEQSKAPKDPELKEGKQTLKELHKHNDGLSSIELKDPNLRQLYKAMKKDDIDFSILKDGKGKYTLFFKGKNADEMTHAMKRYADKLVKMENKPTIASTLAAAKKLAQSINVGRDKVQKVIIKSSTKKEKQMPPYRSSERGQSKMQADKRRAAIYCRVANKDDMAIEQQRESLRQFAAEQGYEDCAEYLDNGASGLTLDRLALQRLNDAMANEEIQTVFVASTSRIGRGIAPVYTWLNYAEAMGVEVISQTEDIGFCTASFEALLNAIPKRK